MLASLLLALAAPAQASPAPAPPAAELPAPRAIRTGEMIADLYLPAASGPAPAILLLGGSDGGLSRAAGYEARALAARGYAVLHLSYFGSPGQAKSLRLLPIETFTRALDWMKAQPEIDGARIGIVGVSKGAEAALIVASRRPDIRVAVLGVPSHVAWPGIDMAEMVTDASWTEGGKPIPTVPYGWSGEWKGVMALYTDGLADAAAVARGTIPAERAGGAIVLICGENDSLWPSCPMARAIAARLRERKFGHPVTVLAYPDAGHSAFGPPFRTDARGVQTIGALGGTIAGNAAARADGWPKVLAAIDAALKR